MLQVKLAVPDPLTDKEAAQCQSLFSRLISLGERFANVAGAVVEFSDQEQMARVAASVLSTSNWKMVAEQILEVPVLRPRSTPDLEGFREAPLLVKALVKLPVEPDVILIYGVGVAHPRMFGVASHVGVVLDHPTIGVFDQWVVGCQPVTGTLGPKRGSMLALRHETTSAHVGSLLRVQHNEDPLYVSPGHRVSVEDAASIVLRSSPWHGFPEPLKRAFQVLHGERKP